LIIQWGLLDGVTSGGKDSNYYFDFTITPIITAIGNGNNNIVRITTRTKSNYGFALNGSGSCTVFWIAIGY